jgi:hypothetical protein
VRALLITLLLLAACGKPFLHPALPVISDELLPVGEPVELSLFALILAQESGRQIDHPVRYPIVLAETTLVADPRDLDPAQLDARRLLKQRWPDSVRAGFQAAFADYERRNQQAHPVSPLALRQRGVQPAQPGQDKCAEGSRLDCRSDATYVGLSAIGFNADSTYAVVYRSAWCGPLCATGIVFLLRRHPGTRWSLWSSELMWIS